MAGICDRLAEDVDEFDEDDRIGELGGDVALVLAVVASPAADESSLR